MKEMNADDEMRELARLREKAMYGEKSALNFARREGRTEGKEEQKKETIAGMRSKGYTEEQIQDLFS